MAAMFEASGQGPTEVSSPNQKAVPAATNWVSMNGPAIRASASSCGLPSRRTPASPFVANQFPRVVQDLVFLLLSALVEHQHEGLGEELVVLDEVAVLRCLNIEIGRA